VGFASLDFAIWLRLLTVPAFILLAATYYTPHSIIRRAVGIPIADLGRQGSGR